MKEFVDAVTNFYNQTAVPQEQENVEDEDEGDILFSTRPPGSRSNPTSQATDPQHVEKLWNWLIENPDIYIGPNKSGKIVEASLDELSHAANPLASIFKTHVKERLHATEDRIWHVLTDHGVDYKRVPKLEFDCLRTIASAGPDGMLQPDVTRITGQDKRSVPKRTDALAQKGFITKETCVGGGIKTSILRFKKFVQHGDSTSLFDITGGKWPGGEKRRMIRYDDWFDEIMGHLMKHNYIIAVEDLRKEMVRLLEHCRNTQPELTVSQGIDGKRWETRALHRCVRRLGKVGCIQRLKARASPTSALGRGDEGHEFENEDQPEADVEIDDSDTQDTPKRWRVTTGPSQVRWVRCLKLLRDPTPQDKAAFTSSAAADKTEGPSYQEDSDAEEDDPDEIEVNDETLKSMTGRQQKKEENKTRPSAQWQPGVHYTQFLFNLIDISGAKGISTMELTDRAMGHLWRRPLDELLGRLSDVWRVSQPPHLRHLSVVRDTAFHHRASHYQFRSYNNFKQLVSSGEVTWEAIDIKTSDVENESPDLDAWGFPRVSPAVIFGHDGTSNVLHCKTSVIAPHARRALEFKSQAGRLLDTPAAKRPYKRRGTASSVKRTNTRAIASQSTESVVRASSPWTAEEDSEREPVSELTYATPTRNFASVASPVSTSSNNAKKGLFLMKPHRVQAELKEWQIRVKRLAEHRVRRGLVKHPAAPVQQLPTEQSSPRKRRKRDSDIDISTANEMLPPTDESKVKPPVDKAVSDSHCQNEPSSLDGKGLPILPEDQVAAVEAEILSMSKPGAYINPPGSGQSKMSITLPVGRPSRYLIAVIKSERLQSLSWFNQDQPFNAPATVPESPSAVPKTAEVALDEPAPATPSTSDPDFVITKGRKRRSQMSLLERATKRQATMRKEIPPNPLGIGTGIVPSSPHSSSPSKRGPTQMRSSRTPKPKSKITAAPYTEAGVVTPPATDQEDADQTVAAPDGTFRDIEEPSQVTIPEGIPEVDPVNKAQRAPASGEPEADGQVTQQGLTSGSNRDSLAQILLDSTADTATASPATPMEEDDCSMAADGERAETPSGHPILSMEQVYEDNTPARTNAPSTRSKVGVQRTGGIMGYKREKILFDIVHRNGGFFGGDRDLYHPFLGEWEKTYTQRPDRHTLDRVIKQLVLKGLLKKLAFTFLAANGEVVTKHILLEPEVDAESAAVKQFQQKMIEHHPYPYIPEGFDTPHLLDPATHDNRTLPFKKNPQLTVRDHFPENEGVFVSRLHPSGSGPVKLGMTEAILKRDIAMRKRKREQEDKRQERYLLAQLDEEITEAQAALQTDFQLNSYVHEPDRALIDRGPRGTGRLQKLQRWNASNQSKQRKALGLLGAERAERKRRLAIDTRKQSNAEFDVQMEDDSVWQRYQTDGIETQLWTDAPPTGYHNLSRATIPPGFGGAIIDVFTMVSPYQRFYPHSGTFSTDPLVVAAPSKPVWSGNKSSANNANDLLPMSIADIFRQADYTSQDDSLQIPPYDAPYHYSQPSLLAVPQRHNKQTGGPFSTAAQFRFLPARTPANVEDEVDSRAAEHPTVSQAIEKQPMARTSGYRASRTGIFVMSEAEEERLVLAVVVVRTLCGGIQQIPNWGIVHQIFHYRFKPNYCRNRWSFIRGKHAGTADRLQAKFQDVYLRAYEQGEVPEIDYMEPEKYDWSSIVDWAAARLEQENIEVANSELPALPRDRRALENSFEVKTPEDVYGIAKEEYWGPLVTHVRREELANTWTHTIPLKDSVKEGPEKDDLMLAKSWVRANVLTPDSEFDSSVAHAKLVKLGESALPQALDELLGAKIIRVENKGRAVPGRNYDISDAVLAAFKRTWDAQLLRKAAAFKQTIDAAFATDGKLSIAYSAPDHELLAMTNLISTGRARVVPLLPRIDNDFAAPWPRLTKWGFTDGNYKTVQMDKERLHFGLELRPTRTYVPGNPVATTVAPPLRRPRIHGEAGARLPLWADINGNLIPGVWDMMLMATLHVLAFRPGLTAEAMAKVYKGKLWAWEVELFLLWAEEVGLARRIGGEGIGASEAGWTTAEWWWLAFAE